MPSKLSKRALAQINHLLGNYRQESLSDQISSTKGELAKALNIGTTGQKIGRAERMLKSLPPTVKTTSKPLDGDELLRAAEALLHAGKLSPTDAQRATTAIHLGRQQEARDILKAACQ
jgi:predicted nucleic acid-binding protein